MTLSQHEKVLSLQDAKNKKDWANYIEYIADLLASNISTLQTDIYMGLLNVLEGNDRKNFFAELKKFPEDVHENFDFFITLLLSSKNSEISKICKEKILKSIFDKDLVENYYELKASGNGWRYENNPIYSIDKILIKLKKMRSFFTDLKDFDELWSKFCKYLSFGEANLNLQTSYGFLMGRDDVETKEVQKEVSLSMKLFLILSARNTGNCLKLTNLIENLKLIYENIDRDEQEVILILIKRLEKYVNDYEKLSKDFNDFWEFTGKI